MRCIHKREVIIERSEGRREKKILQMGVKKIVLPFSDEELALVVIKGWGIKPMMLLTNIKYKRPEEFAHFILESYLTRWKCEEESDDQLEIDPTGLRGATGRGAAGS